MARGGGRPGRGRWTTGELPACSWFVKASRLLCAGLLLLAGVSRSIAAPAEKLPVDPGQWRGFNLLEKFTLRGNAPFKEEDFKWIAELGFNFVRLPTDYRCYTEADDWLKFKEANLREIDEAIAFGEKYGIHVCLNLHRAPGFCINPPEEPRNLWTDPVAQDAFVAHWAMFAKRYRHISPARLSFNLLNEPTKNTREQFLLVNRKAIEAIHAVDPRRLVIVDGNNVGRDPFVEFLSYSPVIQATRGYHPSSVSHYKANWVKGSDKWPEPRWPQPLRPDGKPERSQADYLKPWREIAARGETVFVGEWGCYNKTPHPIALAWMKAWLEEWKQSGFGWALWNFRGSFGVLDSGRSDVKYEDWRGHKLDREMLALLQQYLPERR